MPVPKGVNAEKYDRCVDEVKAKQGGKTKGKVNAYAVCSASMKKGVAALTQEEYDDLKRSLVEVIFERLKNEVTMSEQVKKSEETKTETAATETPAAPAAEAAPAPVEAAPKLAAGLFGGKFTLGSTLEQGPVGNVMANVKKPMMNYEETYRTSTKNEQLTDEQIKQLASKK